MAYYRTDGRRLVKRAVKLRKQGKRREAIAIYDQLIEQHPASHFYNERGVLYSECREFDKAIVDFTDAMALNDADADLFVNRGNAYLWSGAFRTAVDDYTRSLELSPNDACALNGRAQAFAELGNFDDAIADFDAAIRLDDKYVSPLFNLGVVLLRNKQLGAALDYLNRAVELEPHDAAILCTRGDVLEQKQDETSALRDYDRAVAHNPDCVPALCRLSWLLSTSTDESLRRGPQALVHGKACCKLTEYYDANCLEVLARAHAELGEYDEAVRWEKEAMRLTSEERDLTIAQKRLDAYEAKRQPRD